MLLGISVKDKIGLGDQIQFTSLPENYFRHTGRMLVDTAKCWIFDHNPYVLRDYSVPPKLVYELWNFQPHPKPKRPVWLSLAEKHASILNIPVVQKFPRLYVHEDFPFHKREKILLHTHGRSHGPMPDHVIEHVLKKYKGMPLFHICTPSDPDLGIPRLQTPTIWDLVKEISEARMLIGQDSGPSWIAACYPDIIVKKLRTRPTPEHFKEWVPLDVSNIHAQWDDRTHQVFNPTGDDIGFTASYKRL